MVIFLRITNLNPDLQYNPGQGSLQVYPSTCTLSKPGMLQPTSERPESGTDQLWLGFEALQAPCASTNQSFTFGFSWEVAYAGARAERDYPTV